MYLFIYYVCLFICLFGSPSAFAEAASTLPVVHKKPKAQVTKHWHTDRKVTPVCEVCVLGISSMKCVFGWFGKTVSFCMGDVKGEIKLFLREMQNK